MRVDVRALGTCNRLAERGAKRAAAALASLTGTDLTVEVTGASVATDEGLTETAPGESIGVYVGLDGGLTGQAVLALDAEQIDGLLSLLPGDPSLSRSAVMEVGNIALGGFIDGWANHLGRAVDMTPPRYLEAVDASALPGDASPADAVFRFDSRLEAATDLDISISLVPASRPFADLVVGGESLAGGTPTPGGPSSADGSTVTAVTYESLSTFASLAERGAATAADNIGTMTGLETTVDVSRLRFVPLADVPAAVGTAPHAGTVFELQGEPSGYLAILFSESSAARIAEAMLPMEPDEPLGSLAENALCELGNVMTSGFIDGWANVLGTSISHSPPEYVHDIGSATVSPLVAALSRRQDYGFVIDATIRTRGTEARCDVYALPDERELVAVLDRLAHA